MAQPLVGIDHELLCSRTYSQPSPRLLTLQVWLRPKKTTYLDIFDWPTPIQSLEPSLLAFNLNDNQRLCFLLNV